MRCADAPPRHGSRRGGRPPTRHERLFGPRDDSYRGGPAPWDVGRPQAAIVRLGDSGAFAGTVLDPGCGTGEHVLLLAALGHEVVGVDVARRPRPRRRARRGAPDRCRTCGRRPTSSTQVAAIFSDPKGLLNYVAAKDAKKQAEG